MRWIQYGLWQTLDIYPHEAQHIERVEWKKHSFVARWMEAFDCEEATQYWYCIKDTSFDLTEIKAKLRYEINKGNKNYYVKTIDPKRYADEMYDVYYESLEGYDNPVVETKENFGRRIVSWSANEALILFGVFEKESDRLCGYSDVYDRKPYLPISSLKTRVSCEKTNVNFALVYGILEYFREDLENGCYLSDGARNVYHETNFQSWLERYFGFRKAYCRLAVKFRFPLRVIVKILFPFRAGIRKLSSKSARQLYSVLKLYGWSIGIDE